MLMRSKEAPSVASTRILKTHRMNEVETFRLQGRIKNISTESKHNYSQISDEIAGVRKNLTKIKDVPISHGISVERRKLLHEQGMRILPPGRGNESTWKVKTVDGKEFAIENTEFYDGASLRRKISSTSTKPSNPHITIALPEEAKETAEKQENPFTPKSLPYRVITPPHRPGSRQNFKVVERNGSSDEEEGRTRHGLNGYRRRAHTARLVRRQGTRFLLRPRSHTCPNVTAVDKDESAPNTTAAEPNGITRPSSSCGSITEGKGEARKREIKTSPVHQDNSKGGHSRERASSSGDLRLGRNPNMYRRGPGETRRVNSDSTDIITLTKQAQQFGIDNDENLASRFSAKVAWADNRRPERHLMSEDKGTNPSSAGNPSLKSDEHNVGRLNSNTTLENRTKRRNERNGGASHKEQNTSSRRGRALKKDFTTMQMTIGNKQIKVHIPKFSSDLGDNVVDRARVGRPRLSSVSSQ